MRGVRGAITVGTSDEDAVAEGVTTLLATMLQRNVLPLEDVVSVIFTSTSDLRLGYPAKAARLAGWSKVPMLDMQEVDVPGALRRCIGVLLHVARDAAAPVVHVYMRDACALRPDVGDPFPMDVRAAHAAIRRSAESGTHGISLRAADLLR